MPRRTISLQVLDARIGRSKWMRQLWADRHSSPMPPVDQLLPGPDLDGDGILDLYYAIAPQGAPRNLVVRGLPPEPWRRLGRWQAGRDFDGDATVST